SENGDVHCLVFTHHHSGGFMAASEIYIAVWHEVLQLGRDPIKMHWLIGSGEMMKSFT
ncbi:unnamed protein product, partial [Ceratitis capitata]